MNPARLLMIDLSGPELTADERAFLAERRPGGACLFGRNVVDRFQVADYVAELRALAGPELLVAVDQEGGGVVRIDDLPYPPSAMALGAADDPALTRDVAAATGRGLRAVGIDVDFAPVADVNADPANPVIADRSFGADPQQVARHVAAFVEGLQAEGVAATAKHFPGHGDVAIDSHLALPTLDRSVAELERLEWPPFLAAIDAGVAAVMTAHIVASRIDEAVPATLSRAVVTGLLRERLGFDGAVFSDALDMRAIADRWGGPQAAVMALTAGVDMPAQVAPLGVHEATVAAVEGALAEGRLDPAALDASARRLERLSDARRGAPAPDPAAAWREGDERLLDEAARRALVALGDLPRLAPGVRVVLVAARAARQSAATQATVRPAEGLARALRERGVDVREAPFDPGSPRLGVAEIVSSLGAGDVVVYASTARTALGPAEVELARDLARASTAFVHVALWNPYAVGELPGPALATFGWRDRSVRAAAAALLGELEPTGTAPVPLRTLGRGDA